MTEKETNALVDTLEGVMRVTMRTGQDQTCLRCQPLPGGRTEIDGTFYLPVVIRACLAAIARSGYKLVPPGKS